MNCGEAAIWSRKLNARIIENRLSLDAAIFFQGTLHFDHALTDEMLDFQKRALQSNRWPQKAFDGIHKWVDKKMMRDVQIFAEHPTVKMSPPTL